MLGIRPMPTLLPTPMRETPAHPAAIPQGITGSKLGTNADQEMIADLLLGGEYTNQKQDALTAETLFGNKNYYHFLDRERRQELILMLSRGWNAPFWDKPRSERLIAVDPDPEKFGSLGDTPLQRLRGLVERARDYGYGGLGLPILVKGNCYDPVPDLPQWEERARRCQQAGVRLLLISQASVFSEDYLQAVSEIFHRLAPDVLLQITMPWQRYLSRAEEEAIADRQEQLRRLLSLYDAVPICDTFPPFAIASALRNANLAFSSGAVQRYGRQGIPDFEGEAQVAAVLGGIFSAVSKTRETEAALGWQRLSPPFGVFSCGYARSEEMLEDDHYFYRNVERPQLEGHTLRHTAPAVMARGCPLPTVTVPKGITPYVAASRNPCTGAYALGTFQRNIHPNYAVWGLADVTLQVDSTAVPVGLFGLFHSVTLQYPHALGNIRVTVQDPAGYTAPLDVTDSVTVQGNALLLDGKQLGRWGKIGWDDDYEEAPSLVLRIMEN